MVDQEFVDEGGGDINDAAFEATATRVKPCVASLLAARHAQPRRSVSGTVSENRVGERATHIDKWGILVLDRATRGQTVASW